ncbi:MAG TPA: TetR/AcrR family transcriptional regulator [Solirubrobacterales bacterium]|nr:TetR/AcrR family transcriptional regulator [Solirubrobacterales bacterium]
MPSKPPGGSPDYPDELARLPHGRHGLPTEFVEHNQRERLIAAFIELAGKVGYNDATITAIAAGAGVSSRTFYKYFETVEDCCVAAFDLAAGQLGEVLRAAFESESEWPLQVRAALAAAVDRFAADPPVARLLTVEPFVAGPALAERYKAAVDQAIPYLRQGRESGKGGEDLLPDTTERGVLGAINGLVSRQVKAGRAESLPELLPDLVQFALTPYRGASSAREVALQNH